MLTTIRRLLEIKGVDPAQTVYDRMGDELLDYPLTAGDFFDCAWGLKKGKSFYEIFQFYRLLCQEEEKNKIPLLQELMEESSRQLVQIKTEEKGQEKKLLLDMIKSGRRGIREALEWFEKIALREACRRYGGNPAELVFLEYKNRAMVTDYANIAAMIPAMETFRYKEVWNFPWLTTNLAELAACLEAGEKTGVVGGPCIFGIDEVLIEVNTEDGQTELFDCSCGRQCTKDPAAPARTLAGYMEENGGRVRELHIRNRKKGVTRQEFISLLYVFETAALLGSSVVIPLPDLSYVKYMDADLEALPDALREGIMEEFIHTADQVADMFLDVIGMLKDCYRDVPVTVIHRRDAEACRLFYEKRAPFIEGSSYMRKLTRDDRRKESVVDYITMLALPFYVYGTKHVIQLDSLDETDSGRKCQKIHGDSLVLHSILYPEFISRDGMNTLYNTTVEYKDYLKRGDIERWLRDGKA